METGIFKAIAAIMSETAAIGKDKTNTMQGYKFRGIDDVYNAVHPLFAKHGVFSVPQVLEDRTEERTTAKGSALIYRVLKIKYTFFADDGSFIESVVMGEGMDSGDKASNKAMAVAHKYAILQILSIPTNDDKDPEVDSHELKPKAEPRVDEKKSILEAIAQEIKAGSFSENEIAFYRKSCIGKDSTGLKSVLEEVRKDAEAKKTAPKIDAKTEKELEDIF